MPFLVPLVPALPGLFTTSSHADTLALISCVVYGPTKQLAEKLWPLKGTSFSSYVSN